MKRPIPSFLLTMLLGILAACGGGDGNNQATLTGRLVVEARDLASDDLLSNVRVTVFRSDTNAPVVTLFTDGAGVASANLVSGSYYARAEKQGYQRTPPTGLTPISVTVSNGASTAYPIKLPQSAVKDGGYISGVASRNGEPVSGVMVVAENAADGYSSLTDADGVYIIYNVPAGNYSIQGWIVGNNSSRIQVNVTANQETSGADISLTSGVSGSVVGNISFLATDNAEVDVALTHPRTGETVPGLSTITQGQSYRFRGVPKGEYLARASYANDGKVMDPDWLLKFGEPFVTVADGEAERNFSITGAISILSPTNEPTRTTPTVIQSTTPTFSWAAYPSTDDYVLEVADMNGQVVWGGITADTRNVTFAKPQTSATFNVDGSATEDLVSGQVYRWRVYASKDEKSALGWKLISASEDQVGIFVVE